MRLPLKEKGKNPHAIILLNKFYENIKDVFENSIRANIFSIDTKVMLADFSVIEASSFDPNKIAILFQNFERMVKHQIKELAECPCTVNKI